MATNASAYCSLYLTFLLPTYFAQLAPHYFLPLLHLQTTITANSDMCKSSKGPTIVSTSSSQ